jgi:serine phosphatase RsbU (regulator of sigma subunit)
MRRDILIQVADGQPSTVALTGERMTVGRSSTVELSFPDDAGLSRQHFCFEPEGAEWAVLDLGSKNGTFVNNIQLQGRLPLKPGDRVTAGHLSIVYAGGPPRTDGLVVFECEAESPSTATLVTSLEGALANRTMVVDAQAGTSPVQALIRAGQELAQNRPLGELFHVILDLAVDAVGALRGVVMLLEGDELVVKANRGEGFRISSAVRDRVIQGKVSVLVRDTALDEAYRGRASIVEQKVRTMMAVPLQTQDRIIGLIYLDSPSLLRRFGEGDLSLLTVMANVAAIRIEHARLAEVEQQERIMMRELGQAAEIQRRILPQQAPVIARADLAGYNAACRTVGGDYYDFFPYPDGSVGVVVADVSGKGMPAALMVMALQARLHVLAEVPDGVAAMITRLNKITCAHCPSNRFITFFFARCHPASGDVVWANAGHNPPLVVRASGHIETLEGGGPVLGIIGLAQYEEQHAQLETGDLLVLYSDGVTEAINAAEEEYGDERLASVLARHRARTAAEIVIAVTEDLAAFTAGCPQADDITLLVLRRTG